MLIGGCQVDFACCWVVVGINELVFGNCWVGYWWESWCIMLLGDWVARLVSLVVVVG